MDSDIKMRQVVSSNIESIGYDADSMIMRIRFRSGSTYDYQSVPSDVFNALSNSSSHGRFFAQHIKNQYVGEPV